MTGRRYALALLVAFVTPTVVTLGGLLVVTSIPAVEDWVGDQLFKALKRGAVQS